MSENEKKRRGRQKDLRGRTGEPSAKLSRAHYDLPAEVDGLLEELRSHRTELEVQNEELRRAQVELSDLHNKYLDLFDFAPVGYFSLDEKSRVVGANLAGAELLGCERRLLVSKHFLNYVAPEYFDTYVAHKNLVLLSDTRQTCELKLRRADGREFWAELQSIAAMSADEKTVRMRMSVMDISERKRAEKEREKSERLLRTIMDNAPVLISAKDKRGKYILANKKLAASLDSEPEQIIGKNVHEIFPAEIADEIRKNDLSALASNSVMDVEETIVHANGERHIYHTVKFPLYLEEKDAAGTCAISLEITGKKGAEEKLKESEKRFKSLTENLPDVVARLDNKLRHIYVSPIIENLTGIPGDRFIGRTNTEIGMPEELVRTWKEKLLHTLKTGEKTTVEFDLETPHGPRHYQSLIVPEYSGADAPVSLLCVTRDLTERREREQELKRKERELKQESQRLQEANTALKVLIEHRDEERSKLEDSVLTSIHRLVTPYLEKLRKSGLEAHQNTYVDIINSHLKEVTSSFARKLSSPSVGLTSRELEIAGLIREGLTNDEISDLLEISVNAVSFHRKNIRSKLGLKGRKANLGSYLHNLS